MSDSVRINGVQISWSSCVFKLDGEEYTGITAIGYKDGIEEEKGYGMGRHGGPRGRSAGKYTVEPLTLTVWKSTAQAIRKQIAALSPSGRSYGKPIFNAVLQYIEPDDATITVEFEEARYLTSSSSNQEGAPPLAEDIEFGVMRIRRNGLVLWDDSQD